MFFDEIKEFIEQTISNISTELNENMEVTISIKVEEKTIELNNKTTTLGDENNPLKIPQIHQG